MDNNEFDMLFEECESNILYENDALAVAAVSAPFLIGTTIYGIHKRKKQEKIKENILQDKKNRIKQRPLISSIYEIASKLYRFLNQNKGELIDHWIIYNRDNLFDNGEISLTELKTIKTWNFMFDPQYNKENEYDTDMINKLYTKMKSFFVSNGFKKIDDEPDKYVVYEYNKDKNFTVEIDYDPDLSIYFKYSHSK